MAEVKPKRRWFRFSLRTLLAGVAIVAVLIWIPVRRAREQRQAVDEILRRGGTVRFDFEKTGATEPAGPAWLRRLLGDDYFRTVDEVFLDGLAVTDDDLKILGGLPSLERVFLRNCSKIDD